MVVAGMSLAAQMEALRIQRAELVRDSHGGSSQSVEGGEFSFLRRKLAQFRSGKWRRSHDGSSMVRSQSWNHGLHSSGKLQSEWSSSLTSLRENEVWRLSWYPLLVLLRWLQWKTSSVDHSKEKTLIGIILIEITNKQCKPVGNFQQNITILEVQFVFKYYFTKFILLKVTNQSFEHIYSSSLEQISSSTNIRKFKRSHSVHQRLNTCASPALSRK